MNDHSGAGPVIEISEGHTPPTWWTALADLLSARVSLVQLELKQAASSGIKRIIFFAVAAVLLLCAWIILIAGAIGAISDQAGFAWYWVTLAAGAIHLLIAGLLVLAAKRPGDPTFEHTKEEFKKDRQWLANFQSQNKSND